MSFRPLLFAALAALIVTLGVFFVASWVERNQTLRGTPKKPEVAGSAFVSTPIHQESGSVSAIETQHGPGEAEVVKARAALMALKGGHPDLSAKMDRLQMQFKEAQAMSVTVLDNELAELEQQRQTVLPPLDWRLLSEINTAHGERILKLMQGLALVQKRDISEFVHSKVPGDLVTYITKDQAETGRYDASVRLSYPLSARRAYFTKIDPAVGRYREAADLNLILDEYLVAVQRFEANRQQIAAASKSRISTRITELKTNRGELLKRPFSPPPELAEFAKLYSSLTAQLDAAERQVDLLKAAKIQAELDEQNRMENERARAQTAAEPQQSRREERGTILISQERHDFYFSARARQEMRSYLRSQGQPASESDIDYALKLNERLEHYSGNGPK